MWQIHCSDSQPALAVCPNCGKNLVIPNHLLQEAKVELAELLAEDPSQLKDKGDFGIVVGSWELN